MELVESGIDSHIFHLTEQLRSGRVDPPRRDRNWAVTTHLLDPLHNRRSAHYIVVRRGHIPYVPHLAGPPKELSLTHRDVACLLTSLGWERWVSGGRHPVKFVKDGAPPIPLPVHAGAIPVGTLNGIARQAGFANARQLVEAASA